MSSTRSGFVILTGSGWRDSNTPPGSMGQPPLEGHLRSPWLESAAREGRGHYPDYLRVMFVGGDWGVASGPQDPCDPVQPVTLLSSDTLTRPHPKGPAMRGRCVASISYPCTGLRHCR